MLYTPVALWTLSSETFTASEEFYLVTGSCSQGATITVEPSSAAQVKVLTRDQSGLPTGVQLLATTDPMIITLTRQDGVTHTVTGNPKPSQ